MGQVIGYARRSRQRDNGALSLDDQESSIRAWARYRERELSAVLREDDVSGALPPADRPRLGPALRALGPGDVLVVAKLDRLSRSMFDFAELLRQARSAGWSLVCLDPEFDLTTAAGRMVAHVFGAFAEFERDQLVERLHGARRAKAEQGGYVGGPTVPFGRRVEGGRVVEDPDEQRVVARLVAARRRGRTWEQVGEEVGLHPNTARKAYYRETGEPRGRVHRRPA